MTDDPNETTKTEPDAEAGAGTDAGAASEPAPGGEPGGEGAGDLDVAELEAAASAAEDEIGGDREPRFEPIGVGGEEAEEGAEAAVAEAEAAGDETAAYEPDEAYEPEANELTKPVAPNRLREPGTRRLHRGVAAPVGRAARQPKAARTVFAIDPALRIRDNASAVFVIGTVVVFVLIVANAMLLGKGGALTPLPTAVPIVTAGPTPTEGPSETVPPASTPVPSTSAGPSAGPASSAAPSGSPAAS
jgi:hypothetical protein